MKEDPPSVENGHPPVLLLLLLAETACGGGGMVHAGKSSQCKYHCVQKNGGLDNFFFAFSL